MCRRLQQELAALAHRMAFQGITDKDEYKHLAELQSMIERVLRKENTL